MFAILDQMLLLVAYSFLAGLVTILSPCILPLLPIILAGGVASDRHRPLGIIFGFITSFTISTLTFAAFVRLTGIDPETLRTIAIIILIFFGLILVIPALKKLWERSVSRRLPQLKSNKHGFWGGVMIGVSLGLVWTPCVGPILASVIALAASTQITPITMFITFAYALGTSIPLFIIMSGSSWFIHHFQWLKSNSRIIQQIFGILMIVAAYMIYFQLDRKFQIQIIEKFPSYGSGLIKLEDVAPVRQKLRTLTSANESSREFALLGIAPELSGGGNWLNSTPLKLSELRGQVVLIDFWTYTCINCIRTLPYLRAWHEKYSDKGLTIIGVHSPEFEFEKSLPNLERAVKDFNLSYPVVQDNDFKIWHAYDNHFWPAKYLIDQEGNIRYTHFGEGKYSEIESVIQELLGETEVNSTKVNIPTENAVSHSPETYLGYWRISNFASSPSLQKNKSTNYQITRTLQTNEVGFSGNWNFHEKFATASPGSTLEFRYDAKVVNLVMKPVVDGQSIPINIYIDGAKLNTLLISEDKLYELYRSLELGKHLIKLEFPAGGIEVYAFTFG